VIVITTGETRDCRHRDRRWLTGVTAALLAVSLVPGAALAAPVIRWISEPVGPGEVALVYGDDLTDVREVRVWRLPDGEPGAPLSGPARPGGAGLRVSSIQPSSNSLKLVIPPSLPPGVLMLDAGGEPRMIGLPRIEWAQPTHLLPGLRENEAEPGATIQIIGRNFDPAGPAGMRVILRGADGRTVPLAIQAAEKYSVLAVVPRTLPAGDYTVWVHRGFGGSAGWGGGLTLGIRAAAAWPDRILDVREFGARGDNVTDDSDAFRRALEAAERNGGGVVYCPAGTYRLSGTVRVPSRVVVRGDGKDVTWLKWPQGAPRSASDFIPAALTGVGEYGFEGLSLMVRNARSVLRHDSFDEFLRDAYPRPATVGPGPPSEGLPNQARDVFLRQVRVQYLPYAGRPSAHPETDPQWPFSRWGITDSPDRDLGVAIAGLDTLEVSDSEFVGSQRFLDIRNGRFVGNRFFNPMGVSWTDIGGQHIVFERNRIDGASSWRPGRLPLRHIYGAGNVMQNLGRGEREALTFDVNRLTGWIYGPHARIEPWAGGVASAAGRTLQLEKGGLTPGAYRAFDALIVSGRGTGQYRPVEDNDAQSIRVSRDWDVEPDRTSVVLLHRVMGHCTFYRNSAEDVSVLLQFWGPLYDCTFDGNVAMRSQGMWGLGGWFLQWLDNSLQVAVTFHAGVGPSGPTPEGTAEYGYLGVTMAGRLTSLGQPFEYLRGVIFRGNQLSHGHRILVMWGYGGERRRARSVVARDVVVDQNRVAHTPVGIELDANVDGAVVNGNAFEDVREPMRLYAPERVTVLK
jgi:hypothetical protein